MTIDPQLEPFVEGLAQAWPVPPQTLPLEEWRRRAEELAIKARPPRPEGLVTEDFEIAAADRPVRFRTYRPDAEGRLPTLIYMHGGGWTIGSVETHDAITAAIAAETPCVVVSVDFARAPEHPFPAAVEDCRAVVDWVFENLDALGAAPDGVCVGGDSAGGNLAGALTLIFRGDDRRPLAGQVLLYPCMDADLTKPSYRTEADAPFLTTEQMALFWDYYCPRPEQRSDPLAAPMRAGDHRGLPPAYIAVAEHDPIRDDGYAYAERLEAAGVPVTFRPGRGLIHGFLRARAICDAAEQEYQALCAWLRSRV